MGEHFPYSDCPDVFGERERLSSKRDSEAERGHVLPKGAEFLVGLDLDDIAWILDQAFAKGRVGLGPVVGLRGERLAEVGPQEKPWCDLIFEAAPVLPAELDAFLASRGSHGRSR